MKLVLLSGGSGKRLWPLSNDTRSKQFLKVLEDRNGNKQSMVQRVWNQIENVGMTNSAYVATSKMQRDMIHSQIGTEIPLIIEPERQDTFSAIALAASYLYSVDKVSEDEVIVVLPVDPYVEDDFFGTTENLSDILNESNAEIVLIGINPTYPSSKYGYIVPKKVSVDSNYLIVDRFTEKPSEFRAKALLDQGALWNSGVFGFKLKYILNILRTKGLPLQFDELSFKYKSLPKNSFDYEVVEKAKHIVAVPYSGYWKDLGTWNTLTEEMVTHQIGKGIISEESINTHLINELDIPVTVIGGKDIVVAASSDGILVSDKSLSPKIKDMIGSFTHPPMYEERIWGWSRTLDFAKFENGQEMVTKRICIHKGKNSSYHYHNSRDEVWTIIRGEGELALDESISRVKAGDIIHLPAGKKHGIRAYIELEFIEVQTGLGIDESDFVRLLFKWEEVLKEYINSGPKVFL